MEPDSTVGYETGWKSIPLERKSFPPPYMVFLPLVLGRGFQYLFRPFEKTLWSIQLRFKGIPMRLEQGKFGLSLYSPRADEVKLVIQELMTVLSRAARYSDQALAPMVDDLVRTGKITIRNSFPSLDDRYCFFRRRAARAYASPPPAKKVIARDSSGKPSAWSWDLHKPEREGYYFGSATLDAYFSRLEHLLVLTFPFAGLDLGRHNLIVFMGSSWREKFKTVVNLPSSPEAKQLYDSLRKIKERFRNPVSHGEFEKGTSSLLIHVPVVGAIPARLSRVREGIHSSLYPISSASFEEVVNLFDRLDKYLATGPLKYGYRYAESGLSVAYDGQSLEEYKLAMSSDGKFADLLDRQGYFQAQAVNMEW